MGKFDGKQIIGAVGNLVFKKGRDKKVTIVQTKAESVKQTKSSQLTAGIFGNASTLSRQIRRDLSGLYGQAYSGDMVNALTTLNRDILDHCYDKPTKTYSFQHDSFSRLKGFEFNSKSPLSKQLWAEPEVSYADHKLKVSFPEMKVNDDLRFVSNANICELQVIASFFALRDAKHKDVDFQMFDVSIDESVIPAKTLEFDAPEGCLCVFGLGLQYFYSHQNLKDRLNDLSFNPAGILGAVITPGTFVEPPAKVVGNTHYARQWKTIDKLSV